MTQLKFSSFAIALLALATLAYYLSPHGLNQNSNISYSKVITPTSTTKKIKPNTLTFTNKRQLSTYRNSKTTSQLKPVRPELVGTILPPGEPSADSIDPRSQSLPHGHEQNLTNRINNMPKQEPKTSQP